MGRQGKEPNGNMARQLLIGSLEPEGAPTRLSTLLQRLPLWNEGDIQAVAELNTDEVAYEPTYWLKPPA